jgi:hypothetical protein
MQFRGRCNQHDLNITARGLVEKTGSGKRAPHAGKASADDKNALGHGKKSFWETRGHAARCAGGRGKGMCCAGAPHNADHMSPRYIAQARWRPPFRTAGNPTRPFRRHNANEINALDGAPCACRG